MKRKHIFFMESNILVSTWPVLLFNVFGEYAKSLFHSKVL